MDHHRACESAGEPRLRRYGPCSSRRSASTGPSPIASVLAEPLYQFAGVDPRRPRRARACRSPGPPSRSSWASPDGKRATWMAGGGPARTPARRSRPRSRRPRRWSARAARTRGRSPPTRGRRCTAAGALSPEQRAAVSACRSPRRWPMPCRRSTSMYAAAGAAAIYAREPARPVPARRPHGGRPRLGRPGHLRARRAAARRLRLTYSLRVVLLAWECGLFLSPSEGSPREAGQRLPPDPRRHLHAVVDAGLDVPLGDIMESREPGQ